MGVVARSSLVAFCLSTLLTIGALAQRNIPQVSQQNDNMDAPLLRQRAREHAQKRKGGVGTAGRAEPEQDDPRARMEWQRHDRGMPSVEFKEHVLNLRRERSAVRAQAATPGSGSPTWVPIGPTGADYEQNGAFTGFVRDSGRARTILPHPTDSNTVYFLTSGGGLWVTHNFTSATTAWAPLTDSLPTTGGGAVAFGRTSSVLYLGLGDPFDVINSAGAMFKSVDGGTTWTNDVDLVNALSVRDVKVDTSASQDVVLVATDFGLFRSVDGGVSYGEVTGFGFQGQAAWSLARTSAGWLLNAQPCGTLIPAQDCATQATIYLSTDHGATWAPISNTGNIYTGAGRTTLAVGKPGDSIVYAIAENVNSNPNLNDQRDLFRSIDGGQTWTALGLNSKIPTNPNSNNPNMDILHAQAWYNQMVLVDPRDATRNTVYIGGNLSSAKTTDGGTTWTLLSNWLGGGTINDPAFGFGFGLPYAHADFHAAALSTAGTPTLMFGNDGGLFISTDNGTTWSSDKNNGLQTFLFYSLASTPAFPSAVIAGAQDTGTRVRKGNTMIYNQSGGGDGIGTGWGQANSNLAIGTVEFNEYFVDLTNQIPDSKEQFFNWFAPSVNDGAFATPVEVPNGNLDPSGEIFFTSSLKLIDKVTNGNFFTVIGQVGFGGIPSTITLRPSAHSVGVSPVDLQHIAVAGGAGHLEITTNGGATWSDKFLNTLLPGFQSFVSGVAWADNNTLYVTSVAPAVGAVRVAKSTNGGTSWARADNGLPDVPTPRVIIDKRDATNQTLLAASDLGIYRSTDGGANWSPYDTGLPNVHVTDIYMPADGSFLRAATYGRGIWELPSIAFSSATLSDTGHSCDQDGALDNGETGPLTITLHNNGGVALSTISATITSTNPSVSFPIGNVVNFASAAPGADTTAAVTVALTGAVGIQQIDFNIAFTDPSLSLPKPVNALASFRANTDEIPNGSANDNVQSNNSAWTTVGTAQFFPDIVNWQRRQITPIEHRWAGVDSNLVSDESLISPVMQVGSGNFTFSFEQRYFFEWDFSKTWFDGMVLEISTDGGTSWADIGQFATPGYDHILATGGGNVLEGRMAYTGLNDPPYPTFIPVTVNLGTQYAGQGVKVRFRVGTDVAGSEPGAEIRNMTTTGLTNTPFTALVADTGHCSISPTTTTISSNKNPSTAGDLVTFSATVTGGSSTATGPVAFKDGTTTLGTGTLNSSGQTSFATSKLTSGSHNMTGAYSGDVNHATSTSSILVQTVNGVPTTTALVSSLNPSTFGQSVTFTATVSSSKGVPTGKVTFKNGTKVLGTVALTNGVAALSTSTLAAGTPTITAAYGGSTKFAVSSGSILQTVNKAATTSTITGSSPNPSTFGQAVTFTATVTTGAGGGTPGGTVTFMKGTASLGKATLASGTATFTTKTTQLPAGTNSITALYGGDANHDGSTSATFTQTVNKATTSTAVTANPTTITSGQSVTLTATVTATPTSTPTGTVSFTDGTTNLGNASLSNGSATLVTTGIVGTGTHTINGTYKANSNYLGSFGTVTVTVQ